MMPAVVATACGGEMRAYLHIWGSEVRIFQPTMNIGAWRICRSHDFLQGQSADPV